MQEHSVTKYKSQRIDPFVKPIPFLLLLLRLSTFAPVMENMEFSTVSVVLHK